MGRWPMGQPPGREVSARPSRASSGAQKRMEARIRAAASPGRVLHTGVPLTTTSAPCRRASHPAPRSSARQHSTSDSAGTARSRTVPQHAVFRRRHRRRPVQRPPAHHPDPPALLCHIPGPLFSKRYPTVCGSGEICLQFWQKALPFGELAQSAIFCFFSSKNMLYLFCGLVRPLPDGREVNDHGLIYVSASVHRSKCSVSLHLQVA